MYFLLLFYNKVGLHVCLTKNGSRKKWTSACNSNLNIRVQRRSVEVYVKKPYIYIYFPMRQSRLRKDILEVSCARPCFIQWFVPLRVKVCGLERETRWMCTYFSMVKAKYIWKSTKSQTNNLAELTAWKIPSQLY